jgi:hypothetical protein|eukprot:COSAG06_NODE_4507_length_4194_cov_2.591941_3_plen_269_part_00
MLGMRGRVLGNVGLRGCQRLGQVSCPTIPKPAVGPAVTSRWPGVRGSRCRSWSSTAKPSAAPPPPPEPQPGAARRLWAAYVGQLEARPLPVKLASSVVIFGLGDVATQMLLEGTPLTAIDVQRTGRLVAFGLVATAYVSTWWGVLEPRAAMVFCPQAQRLQNTLFKVFCDQTFGAGSFNVIFFGQSALMEGKTPQQALERIKEQWWPQMQRHWCLWPAFHSLNFYYNPLHLRVFFQNVMLVGWSALLSTIGKRTAEAEAARMAAAAVA